MSIEQRFHEKVVPVTETGCWLWTAHDNSGYGRFWAGGRPVYAHRYAWELVNGPIPEGLHVLHRCDTPLCVNPEHLFLGTNADNNADMRAKGRDRTGDRRGSKNSNAKLTEAQAVEVFLADGLQEDIGERYGISGVQVSQIKSRSRWSHATEGLSA